MIKFANGDPSVNPFNEFLKSYGMWIAIGIAFLLAVILLTIYFLSTKHKRKKVVPIPLKEPNYESIINSLGGKDNVIEHSLNGSRISIVLKDYSLVNDDELNQHGVDSVIKMSNKITLVVKGDPKTFYKRLF